MNKKLLSLFLAAVITVSALAIWPGKAAAAGSGSSAGVVSVAWGSLNVRSSDSSASAIVTTLAKGSYVTLLSKSGAWWKVEYAAGKTGFCSDGYIQPVSGSYAAYVAVSSGYLNVRTGAGTSYTIRTALANGTGLVVLSQSNGWSRILYQGTQTGYVSSTYIRAYTAAAPSSFPAISLSVPSYKQTDSRWSGTKIGTQGNTIATAGCLTTAIAMSESYRTGTAVYPNTLAAKSTYTPGGAIYWPSHYVFSFDSAYLQAVYAKLKEGKPVIFGAKNAYGAQHWVVVTSYTGGNTLTASGFTVNDPGSVTKTNLQHLLNTHPTFYKFAYYI